jgi:hypothetical protein
MVIQMTIDLAGSIPAYYKHFDAPNEYYSISYTKL